MTKAKSQFEENDGHEKVLIIIQEVADNVFQEVTDNDSDNVFQDVADIMLIVVLRRWLILILMTTMIMLSRRWLIMLIMLIMMKMLIMVFRRWLARGATQFKPMHWEYSTPPPHSLSSSLFR